MDKRAETISRRELLRLTLALPATATLLASAESITAEKRNSTLDLRAIKEAPSRVTPFETSDDVSKIKLTRRGTAPFAAPR
jgi:hypothetical protein